MPDNNPPPPAAETPNSTPAPRKSFEQIREAAQANPKRRVLNNAKSRFVVFDRPNAAPSPAAVNAPPAAQQSQPDPTPPVQQQSALAKAVGAAPQDAKPLTQEDKEALVDFANESRLTPDDFAKRLDRLSKADKRLTEAKEAFAQERARHKADLERIKQLEQGRAAAIKDPLGFMKAAFGIDPSHIWDALAKNSNQTPQQVQLNTLQRAEASVAAYEKKLRELEEGEKEKSINSQVSQYKQTTLASMYQDNKLPYTQLEHGNNTVEELWKAITDHNQQYGHYPTHEQVIQMANKAEGYYKDKYQRARQLEGESTTSPDVANPAAKPGNSQSKTGSSGNQTRREGTLLKPSGKSLIRRPTS